MRRATRTLTAALAGFLFLSGPAVADAHMTQARLQVERGLNQMGIHVPGGVETLSNRQVLELLAEINLRERDWSRWQRIRQIIARDD